MAINKKKIKATDNNMKTDSDTHIEVSTNTTTRPLENNELLTNAVSDHKYNPVFETVAVNRRGSLGESDPTGKMSVWEAGSWSYVDSDANNSAPNTHTDEMMGKRAYNKTPNTHVYSQQENEECGMARQEDISSKNTGNAIATKYTNSPGAM